MGDIFIVLILIVYTQFAYGLTCEFLVELNGRVRFYAHYVTYRPNSNCRAIDCNMTEASYVSNSRPKYRRTYVRDTMQQRSSAYKFIIIIINDNLYSAVCTRSTSRALIVH